MGLAVAVLYSCRKDGLNGLASTVQTGSQSNNADLWNRINKFRVDLRSGERDLDPISPDSALWYLEAMYNVEQSVDTSYNFLDLDTTYYTLVPDGDGMVDMQQVSDVYDSMVADLNASLQSKSTDYAYLILGDLSENNLSRDGNFNMQLISGLGIDPLDCYDPFYDIDDWYYGNMLGREDGAYKWESDAGQELQKRFNNPKNCMFQGGGYWVSVVEKNVDSLMYPNRKFQLQLNAPGEPIINDTLMRYYLAKGHSDIIYSYEADSGQRPPGLDFKMCNVWTNNANTPTYFYYHSYTLYYGIQISNPQ